MNVRLSLYGVERLKRFTEEIGGNAELRQVGYLFLIDDPATWVEYQRSVAMQRRLGARVELLTPEQAAGGTFPGPARWRSRAGPGSGVPGAGTQE